MLRKYKIGDSRFVGEIYQQTIQSICIKDYTIEQCNAWGGTAVDENAWQQRMERKIQNSEVLICERNDVIVGYGELDKDGHIDNFYVHKDYQRLGVGREIYQGIEKEAMNLGLSKLFVEVSITARDFFKSMGFTEIKENYVNCGSEMLKNYIMEKFIKFV